MSIASLDLNIPFIILGTGRCGTTLLSAMLNSHHNIAVPPEAFFWNTFSNLILYYGDLGNPANMCRFIDDVLSTPHIRIWSPQLTRDQVLGNLQSESICGVYQSVVSSWAKNNNKARWGEQTPQNVLYWKEINECIPNLKVIHIVRDGRDVALSYLNARFGPKTVYRAAKKWADSLYRIREIQSSINKERFYELKYEQLLVNPDKSLRAICEFLNEDYSAEMLDFYEKPIHYTSNVYDLEHLNISKPLMNKNINKWQNQMSEHEIKIFESVGWKELIDYGYSLSSHVRNLKTHELLYINFVLDPVKKFYAMLKNTTGQREAFKYLQIKIRIWLRHMVAGL